MAVRLLLAVFHLLGLGIGLGAVWARFRALRGTLDPDALRRAVYADTLWGIAALLWLSTGLIRLFGQYEKSLTYYVDNHLFWTKMGLFTLIFVLEITAIATFTRWRRALRTGETMDTRAASRIARVSVIQAAVVVLIVACATAMARGLG